MGRGRGSRCTWGRSIHAAATPVDSCSANDLELPLAKATLQGSSNLGVYSALKLPPKALAQAVDGSDSTPSTASPSHAGTAVSTPTSHGTMMASGESMSSTLYEAKKAESIVNDRISHSLDECPPSMTVAALRTLPSSASRGPEPWALSGTGVTCGGNASAKSGGYRDLLRSRGQMSMQSSHLWRPIASTEVSFESGGYLSENLPAVQALGLTWNASCATASPPGQVPQWPFDPTVFPTGASGQLFIEPQVPPMPPLMHAPTVALDMCSLEQLLGYAMPGPLSGLSNMQIEEQLRAAAAQIDVYDD